MSIAKSRYTVEGMDDADDIAHSHPNKDLLDTLTETTFDDKVSKSGDGMTGSLHMENLSAVIIHPAGRDAQYPSVILGLASSGSASLVKELDARNSARIFFTEQSGSPTWQRVTNGTVSNNTFFHTGNLNPVVKTGDTMTGNLTIDTTGQATELRFRHGVSRTGGVGTINETEETYLGAWDTSNNNNNSIRFNSTSTAPIFQIGTDRYTMWHSGNLTPATKADTDAYTDDKILKMMVWTNMQGYIGQTDPNTSDEWRPQLYIGFKWYRGTPGTDTEFVGQQWIGVSETNPSGWSPISNWVVEPEDVASWLYLDHTGDNDKYAALAFGEWSYLATINPLAK